MNGSSRSRSARLLKPLLVAAACLGALSLAATPGAADSSSAQSSIRTTLDYLAVEDAAGASTDTNYAVPDGALFVAPNGNDEHSGSQLSPLATVKEAISRTSDGGTVVLRGGTYRQSIEDEHINKAVTLQAYPHERPVFTGADIWTRWHKVGNAYKAIGWSSPFKQIDTRYQEYETITPEGRRAEQVLQNGKQLHQVGSPAQLTGGTFFVDPETLELFIHDDPTDQVMEIATREHAFVFTAAQPGTAIKGLTFTNYATQYSETSAMVVLHAAGFVAQDNVFTQGSGNGFFASGSDAQVTFRNNTVDGNGAEGAVFDETVNAVVADNEFAGNNAQNVDDDACGPACSIGGLKITRSENPQVVGNVLLGNDGPGLHCDLGCNNAHIERNVSRNNNEAGMIYETSSRGQIVGNYVADNVREGIWISGSNETLVSGNSLVNNKYQLVSYTDPRVDGGRDEYSIEHHLVWQPVNNTVVNNVISGGPSTEWLLLTNYSQDIEAPAMFKQLEANSVSGNQRVVWYASDGFHQFDTLNEFHRATGLSFGTYSDEMPSAADPFETLNSQ